MLELPISVEELTQKGQTMVSWVSEIPDKTKKAVDYFFMGKEKYAGTRLFWQTPDQETTIVGFGTVDQIVGKSYPEVASLLKNIKRQCYTNAKEAQTGPVYLGAFPFDPEVDSTRVWQTSGQGIFNLPRLMVTQSQGKLFLTINLLIHTPEQFSQDWQLIEAEWLELTQTPVTKVAEVDRFEKQELYKEEWLEVVAQAVRTLKTSETLKKVVLARQQFVQGTANISTDRVLANLLVEQQANYFYVIETPEETFIGATPERLLAATSHEFMTACVAGSAPRGETPLEDLQLGSQLLDDLKNQGEHQVVVEMIATEMTKITDNLSDKSQATLLKNRDIQHLFLPFRGARKASVSFSQGIQQLHPTPALGGEPKAEAMSWIRAHELMPRGLYGGPVGWFSVMEDQGEFAVGIRSAVVKGQQALLYAGCGIVPDSQPEKELAETSVKFQPMLRAIGGEALVTSKSNDTLFNEFY